MNIYIYFIILHIFGEIHLLMCVRRQKMKKTEQNFSLCRSIIYFYHYFENFYEKINNKKYAFNFPPAFWSRTFLKQTWYNICFKVLSVLCLNCFLMKSILTCNVDMLYLCKL